MNYQIQITPELKARLDALAAREGTTADAVAVRTLQQHLPAIPNVDEFSNLMRQWNEEDESEPDDDSFFLELDAHRPSYRKLFLPELKGTTW